MDSAGPDRYAGMLGLGLMYLWGATLFGWIEWYQSEILFVKVVGIIGMVLASLTGISTFLYVNGLESKLKQSQEKSEFYEAQAKAWMNQTQQAARERATHEHS